MSLSRVAIFALLAAGCATADRVQQLEEKVTQLETKVADLDKSGATKSLDKAQAASSEEEDAAKAIYDQLVEVVGKGDTKTAKAKLDELEEKYPSTRATRSAGKFKAELEVIGKKTPSDWNKSVEKWYQGESEVDLNKGTTLVVFWEVWCPHCRREVPNLKETYTKFKGKGLDVVGFTKITKSATEEKVLEFLKEQEVNYPAAKENGSLSQLFNVSGIPAAAVVKDGEIIWRGHPARLNDDMINGWL